MKQSKLIKRFGAALILFSLWWLIASMMPVFAADNLVDALIFAAFVLTIMIAPGGFGLYFGWRLWTCPDKTSIKGGVGLVVVLGVMYVAFWIKGFLPKSYGEDLAMLSGALVAIPVYVKTSRFLMARAGLIPKQRGEFVGKGIALILVLLTLNLMGSLFGYFVGDEKVSEFLASEWGTLGFLGLIILIYLTYQVSVGYREAGAKEKRERESNTGTVLPEA